MKERNRVRNATHVSGSSFIDGLVSGARQEGRPHLREDDIVLLRIPGVGCLKIVSINYDVRCVHTREKQKTVLLCILESAHLLLRG